LETVLLRNVYGDEDPGDAVLASLSDYVRRSVASLADQSLATLMSGEILFELALVEPTLTEMAPDGTTETGRESEQTT
ncbi:MAG: ubiquinol-cytochrome C chaperone family protein, partial [Alphaproteobacteria bacterium]|nr:ubiquinol-cytochrome C chaperone family protein [Alphaproteobacteria bacterium]